MKKAAIFLFVLLIFLVGGATAQKYYGGKRVVKPIPRRAYQKPQPSYKNRPFFEPTVNVNIGFGFPNVDQYRMAEFYNAYKGNVSQTGPVMAALDYQFSRHSSIGIMATYGKVSAPYYKYDAAAGDPFFFDGKLENTSLMLNFVNYFTPSTRAVSPYLRTAAGVNIWNQRYNDAAGRPLNYIVKPAAFAYQASLGAKFNLSKTAGLFVEAGYGKYIVSGGLSLKFK